MTVQFLVSGYDLCRTGNQEIKCCYKEGHEKKGKEKVADKRYGVGCGQLSESGFH